MKRLLLNIKTEIFTARSSLPFHIVALLSPIMFFFVFAGQLDTDISFPVNFSVKDTPFYSSIDSYKSPAGTPYYRLDNDAESILIIEAEPLEISTGKLSGSIVQVIGSIDKNMTKNYRNRLTGAVSNYFSSAFPEKAIKISETLIYEKDPSWSAFFGASILIFGILLSGLLFGAFSFTREWETKNIDLLKLSPVSPVYVLSGKFLGALIKSLITIVLYVIFISLKLKTLIFISIKIIGMTFLLYSTVIIVGMLIGLTFKKTLVSFITALISSILLWALGGGFGARAGMSRVVQFIININPVSRYMNIALHSCFNGPINLSDIIYPLIVFTVSLFLFSLKYYLNIYRPKFRTV